MTISYEYVEEIDSTNNELKRRAAEGKCQQYDVLSAGTQTGGRGRSGHTWSSPVGDSISTSMILFPRQVSPKHIPRITPIAAVAVAETIEELCGLSAGIKWPNDVLINKKKVCGILNELIPDDEGRPDHVVVGIGVNVHIKEFDPAISGMATSLDLEIEAMDRPANTHCGAITVGIWEHFAKHYEAFLHTEDLSEVISYYNDRLVNKGQQVRVLDPISPFEGEALFMDETGALHIMTSDGERVVDSGEVSVRGLYGYI